MLRQIARRNGFIQAVFLDFNPEQLLGLATGDVAKGQVAPTET